MEKSATDAVPLSSAAAAAAAALPPPSASPRLQPRPVRSALDATRIRRQNRRLEYLRRHPAYLASSDREFASVTLYNTLVRSFQTPAERTTEAREKGFGQVLEASILRNPEPLARNIDDVEEEEEEKGDDTRMDDANGNTHNGRQERLAFDADNGDDDPDSERRPPHVDPGNDQFAGPSSLADSLPPREAARRRWLAFVSDWFVQGGAADDGFDYAAVDDDSELDALERADAEAAWYDDESPGWASDGDEEEEKKERVLQGETGIQDF